MINIEYNTHEPGTMDEKELLTFLEETEKMVVPPLGSLVNLEEYAHKLAEKAVIFAARDEGVLVGISALYFNKAPEYSYSSFTMVRHEYQKNGMIGIALMDLSGEYAKQNHSAGIHYEIRKSNKPLLIYHQRQGATILKEMVYPHTDVVSLLMEIRF